MSASKQPSTPRVVQQGMTSALWARVELGAELESKGLPARKRFLASELEEVSLPWVLKCSRRREGARKPWMSGAKTVELPLSTIAAGEGTPVCEACVQVFIGGRTGTPHFMLAGRE